MAWQTQWESKIYAGRQRYTSLNTRTVFSVGVSRPRSLTATFRKRHRVPFLNSVHVLQYPLLQELENPICCKYSLMGNEKQHHGTIFCLAKSCTDNEIIGVMARAYLSGNLHQKEQYIQKIMWKEMENRIHCSPCTIASQRILLN